MPLTADVTTTANVQDNQMYTPLTSPSSSSTPFSVFSLPSLRYIVADLGYDAKKLYGCSKSIGNRSGLSSVERYESTSEKRLELVCFYESEIGKLSITKEGYPSNR